MTSSMLTESFAHSTALDDACNASPAAAPLFLNVPPAVYVVNLVGALLCTCVQNSRSLTLVKPPLSQLKHGSTMTTPPMC
jgi:hypothetical protein